ncbi:sterol desaturase family protein [Aegicerativicinus sediminis]
METRGNMKKLNYRPKNEGSGTIFKNPILEFLTKTHISIPLSLYTIISGCLIYYGIIEKGFETIEMIFLFFAGMFVFTFFEYMIHRFAFHFGSHEHDHDKNHISYKLHGVHHEYPRDKMRLAMPPIMALALATFFFIVYRTLMGDYVFGFLAGFLMGYTLYLSIHYSIHVFQVPNNFLKILWRHHAIHHYRQPNRAYGVSSPLWDHIFGTMPETKSKPVSEGKFIDPS